MDCPKCVGVLQKSKIEGIELDVCFICEGIWFDAEELEEVIKKDSKDFDYIDAGREKFDGKELSELHGDLDKKQGKCPRCADGTMLIKSEYKGKHKINVDVCPKGHGIWLDGGEIHELRKRGLVEMRDAVIFYTDFVKYIFSKEGFYDTINESIRIVKEKLGKKKPEKKK